LVRTPFHGINDTHRLEDAEIGFVIIFPMIRCRKDSIETGNEPEGNDGFHRGIRQTGYIR